MKKLFKVFMLVGMMISVSVTSVNASSKSIIVSGIVDSGIYDTMEKEFAIDIRGFDSIDSVEVTTADGRSLDVSKDRSGVYYSKLKNSSEPQSIDITVISHDGSEMHKSISSVMVHSSILNTLINGWIPVIVIGGALFVVVMFLVANVTVYLSFRKKEKKIYAENALLFQESSNILNDE